MSGDVGSGLMRDGCVCSGEHLFGELWFGPKGRYGYGMERSAERRSARAMFGAAIRGLFRWAMTW